MTRFARPENGVVIHVLRVDPATIWPADIAALYRKAPEGVEEGWLDNGKTFTAPQVQAAPVPEVVEAWQAKRALIDAGHYAAVAQAIADLPDDPESLRIRVDWTDAKTFRRDWPALVALAATVDLDAGDLDALFIHAATL